MYLLKLLSVPVFVAILTSVAMHYWLDVELSDYESRDWVNLLALAIVVSGLSYKFWVDFLDGGTAIQVGDEVIVLGSDQENKVGHGPIVEELSRNWQDTYESERDISLKLLESFKGRLADGSYYETPLPELKQEYQRLTSSYKDSDQKLRQVTVLIQGSKRKLTYLEKRKYIGFERAIELAYIKAEPEKRTRNKLIYHIHRARKRVEAATDDETRIERQEQVKVLEKDLELNRKTGRTLTHKAEKTEDEFETWQTRLLDKWVKLDSVGYDWELIDRPMPDPAESKDV